MRVDLAPGHSRPLVLANPVMTSSGTFGYGVEYVDLTDVSRLGAVVCKGTTLHPRAGNPPPRVAETAAGMLNAIGLQNVGVHAVIRDHAPIWARWSVPVLVNISGESVDEYAEMARLLDQVAGVAGLEINISCPNLAAGGMEFGVDPEAAAAVVRAVRAATSLPLLVKLSPNVSDIRAMARAVERAGANAISLVNTLLAMGIEVDQAAPTLANVTGGLSGPAIKPVALRMVYQVAQVVRVPVVGIGGITTWRDALEFIMAGARAVQVGTAHFANPRASLEVLEGLERWQATTGQSLDQVVGAVQPARRQA